MGIASISLEEQTGEPIWLWRMKKRKQNHIYLFASPPKAIRIRLG
jgi:hypothetical protein